eukprot:117969-Alexandrium_andersonii.AAC.1
MYEALVAKVGSGHEPTLAELRPFILYQWLLDAPDSAKATGMTNKLTGQAVVFEPKSKGKASSKKQAKVDPKAAVAAYLQA